MRHLINTLVRLKWRQRSRKHLLRLTPSQLDDIAITWQQAEEEARRPFWV